MSEPTSVIATAGVASVPIITIAGLNTGLPVDMILPSFVGAVWALVSVQEGRFVVRVTQVFFGTLLAAWSAQPIAGIAAGIAVRMLPSGVSISSDALSWPVAFGIGYGGLSVGLRWIRRRLGETS